MVELGLLPGRASLQAELDLAQARRDKEAAMLALGTASQALSALTGESIGMAPLELPEAPVRVPDFFVEALHESEGKRLDLQAAAADRRAAEGERQ